MLKKMSLCFIIILTVFSLGCVSYLVSIDIPNDIILVKNIVSPITVSYESRYSEPQIVTVSLNTSDSRLGLSLNAAGPYQQAITFTEEVGTNYPNKKSIYVNTIDSSIPAGDYKIFAGIKGEKSKESDWVRGEMVVHIRP